MKKTIWTVLAALVLMAGCVEENPFVADPDAQWQGGADLPRLAAYGTLSGGLGNYRFNDLDPALEGIQDGIMLQFDEPMSSATMTAAAFEMVTTTPPSGPVEFTSIQYFPGEKTAVLEGTFTGETAYLLTIPAGALTDLAGNCLDPNHNALYDGAPLDNQRVTFFTGSARTADVISPSVSASWPQGGGLEPLQPEIALIFADGPMNQAQLNLDNFTLVRTSDQRPVELRVTLVESDRILCTPVEPLENGTRYTVTMSAAITDEAGNLFDTNNDGWIWPDEPDRTWDFQLVDNGDTHATPPTVLSASMDGETLVIEFRQSLTGNTVVMDPLTFVAANIQCMDTDGAVPLTFEPGIGGGYVVCFLQRPVMGALMVHVSCNVADTYGNLLDGDGNGIGGVPGEDDWSGTPGV
jgi:hypothetical protein